MSVTTAQKVTTIEPLKDIKYIKADYFQKKVSDYQECNFGLIKKNSRIWEVQPSRPEAVQ